MCGPSLTRGGVAWRSQAPYECNIQSLVWERILRPSTNRRGGWPVLPRPGRRAPGAPRGEGTGKPTGTWPATPSNRTQTHGNRKIRSIWYTSQKALIPNLRGRSLPSQLDPGYRTLSPGADLLAPRGAPIYPPHAGLRPGVGTPLFIPFGSGGSIPAMYQPARPTAIITRTQLQGVALIRVFTMPVRMAGL